MSLSLPLDADKANRRNCDHDHTCQRSVHKFGIGTGSRCGAEPSCVEKGFLWPWIPLGKASTWTISWLSGVTSCLGIRSSVLLGWFRFLTRVHKFVCKSWLFLAQEQRLETNNTMLPKKCMQGKSILWRHVKTKFGDFKLHNSTLDHYFRRRAGRLYTGIAKCCDLNRQNSTLDLHPFNHPYWYRKLNCPLVYVAEANEWMNYVLMYFRLPRRQPWDGEEKPGPIWYTPQNSILRRTLWLDHGQDCWEGKL